MGLDRELACGVSIAIGLLTHTRPYRGGRARASEGGDRFLQELAHELHHCNDIPGDGELARAMRAARDKLPAAAMRFQ